MKPYVVVGYRASNIFDFPGPREARHPVWADGRVAAVGDYQPSVFDGSCLMYFCETDGAAKDIAHYMAIKVPNVQWMVSKVSTVFQSSPGPVKQATLTDKGLLPV